MTDLRDPTLAASDIIAALGLAPHPEGGHYRETWRDVPPGGGRGAGTAIFFLLARDERSRPHRLDAAELWLWHAGASLRLRIGDTDLALGPDLAAGETPQALVPAGTWQAACSLGAWTLVTCAVAPAFAFSGFELTSL